MSAVCWHDDDRGIEPEHWRQCPHRLIVWGRCRSGRRWFWAAQLLNRAEPTVRYGRADTEESAVEAARAAVVELAGGRPAAATRSHGSASHVLRTVNREARKARPSDRTGTAAVEFVYGIDYGGEYNDFERSVVAFRVTKKTPKRIYYVRSEGYFEDGPEIGYVDRLALERDGKVVGSRGWWYADSTLYAEPPDVSRSPSPDRTAELKRLKVEMADAHPDRGGSSERFIAARASYERAKATAS